MKISAKGRYALAATTIMAQCYNKNEHITLISISDKLGISKIYLEQVFSLLKRGEIVNSVKGSQGGYRLARLPYQITILEILSAIESSLFEKTEESVSNTAPEIEAAIRFSVYDPLDTSILSTLQEITLSDLVSEAEKNRNDLGLMFYI